MMVQVEIVKRIEVKCQCGRVMRFTFEDAVVVEVEK